MSIASFVVFLGSIIGKQLAPDPAYATLPVGAFVLGSALATLPVILSMRSLGRKSIFIACAALAVGGAMLAIYGLAQQSFGIFVAAVTVMGLGLAAGQQYRFAAMESVPVEDMSTAASRVLIGGIVAAFLGPEIAVRGKNIFEVAYAGSFALLIGVTLLAMLVLSFYKEMAAVALTDDDKGSRRLSTILAQPVLWVAVLSGVAGFAVMSLVMTATPLHMHFENGHSLITTKWVIQSHIVAMFLPSFFVPWLARRIGELGLISLGAVAFLIMVVAVFSRYEFTNYWVSLVLLGVGWNFLFVGGTTLLPRAYRESEKFKIQAFNDFTIFGVQAGGALMAGWLLASFGWQTLLLITIPVLGLLFVAVLYWRWAERQVARDGVA
ncbi:MAG: MFS transporter [Gammaproteobacteria bacterium]|nr:MAG: MFS transporter [Gammaproteobacteria bacterium]RLA53563.1 MAG: MFS transporter [Gammaproteobacteria bacterium]